MKKIFDPENAFMQAISCIVDLMILSILWSVCCIPIITIGPATAALYYVVMKIVTQSDSSICASFLRSFRQNLRQGMVLTLIAAAVVVLLLWDRDLLIRLAPEYGDVIGLIFLLLGAVFVLGLSFLFPLLARYRNSILGTLRNAFLLAFTYLPRAVAMGALNLIPLAVFLFAPNTFYRILPVWFIAAPGLIAYFCSLLLKKPFGLSAEMTP